MKSISSDVCSPLGVVAERACNFEPEVPLVELDTPLPGRMNLFDRSVASESRRDRVDWGAGLLGVSPGGPDDLRKSAKSRVDPPAGFASRASPAFGLADERPVGASIIGWCLGSFRLDGLGGPACGPSSPGGAVVFKKSAKSAVLERLARQRGESGSYRAKSVVMFSSPL